MNMPRRSFCGKDQADVCSLIAGRTVFICDECVQSAVGMTGAEHPQWLEDLIAAMTHEP
jgi:ATP-dependent protease Clp ATPase subunit